MAKTKGEDDKKHGDTLESLIDRTGGSSQAKRKESAGNDPAELQDDDDEDVESDDPEDDQDIDERD